MKTCKINFFEDEIFGPNIGTTFDIYDAVNFGGPYTSRVVGVLKTDLEAALYPGYYNINGIDDNANYIKLVSTQGSCLNAEKIYNIIPPTTTTTTTAAGTTTTTTTAAGTTTTTTTAAGTTTTTTTAAPTYYQYSVKLDSSNATICAQSPTIVYSSSSPFANGMSLYIDAGLLYLVSSIYTLVNNVDDLSYDVLYLNDGVVAGVETPGLCIPAGVPTVTTSTILNIIDVSASGGGNVTSDGGAAIIARGVCWSTSQNPTISDPHTTNGASTGSFSSSITGLIALTTYYVRAYATNSAGTSYGSQVSFTTLGALISTLFAYVATNSSDLCNSNPDTTVNNIYSNVAGVELVDGRSYYNSDYTPYTDNYASRYYASGMGQGSTFGYFGGGSTWTGSSTCA